MTTIASWVLRANAENIHIDHVELTSAPDASTVVSGLQTSVYNFADIEPSQAEAAKKAGLTRASWAAPPRSAGSCPLVLRPVPAG